MNADVRKPAIKPQVGLALILTTKGESKSLTEGTRKLDTSYEMPGRTSLRNPSADSKVARTDAPLMRKLEAEKAYSPAKKAISAYDDSWTISEVSSLKGASESFKCVFTREATLLRSTPSLF